MYKLTTKNGSLIFSCLDDLFDWLSNHRDTYFSDGAFVKIMMMEDNK